MKIELCVSTGRVGSQVTETIKVDDEELEGMTEEEQDEHIEENYGKEWLFNNIEWSWKRAE